MKRFSRARGCAALALGLALAGAGCAGDVTSPAAALEPPLATSGNAGVMFNPQPEPPARVLTFVVTGDFLRMAGRIDGGGEVIVAGLDSCPEGAAMHVVQRWEIHPPEPVVPTTIQLAGIINTANGLVVLNGRTADGALVHVRGAAQFSEGGTLSIGGELMFNPQPEPPAR